MMTDRTGGPDGTQPFRRFYLAPARLGSIATGWYNPRGVRMYWRGKYNDGIDSTSYPAWNDSANVSTGPLTGIGGTVTNGRTMTLNYDLAGRVIPHTWVYTILKISGGVSTRTVHNLVITGTGEYTITFTAPVSGSAVLEAGSNRNEYLIPDDS